nr:hypothetical protein [Tanacetum cinerariifolium]
MTRQKYTLKTIEFALLFDYLSQFESNVYASKSKKCARNHDPLALVANSRAHSSNSHASSSYSRLPQPYYVTHSSSVIDNDDDYQGKIQGVNQEDNLTTAMMDQMLLTTKDEARVHLDEEDNDFMLDNAYEDNTLEELNAAVIMMARIQPTDDKSDAKPTYDAEFISE